MMKIEEVSQKASAASDDVAMGETDVLELTVGADEEAWASEPSVAVAEDVVTSQEGPKPATAKKEEKLEGRKVESPLKTTLKSRLATVPYKHDFAALSGRPAPWNKRVTWTEELASALPGTGSEVPDQAAADVETVDVGPADNKETNISKVWSDAFDRIITLRPEHQSRIWKNYHKLVTDAASLPFVPPVKVEGLSGDSAPMRIASLVVERTPNAAKAASPSSRKSSSTSSLKSGGSSSRSSREKGRSSSKSGSSKAKSSVSKERSSSTGSSKRRASMSGSGSSRGKKISSRTSKDSSPARTTNSGSRSGKDGSKSGSGFKGTRSATKNIEKGHTTSRTKSSSVVRNRSLPSKPKDSCRPEKAENQVKKTRTTATASRPGLRDVTNTWTQKPKTSRQLY